MDAYEEEQQSRHEARKRFIERSRQTGSTIEGYKVEYRLATLDESKGLRLGLREDISSDWDGNRGEIYLIKRSGNCQNITPQDIKFFDEKALDLFEMDRFKPFEAIMSRKSSF